MNSFNNAFDVIKFLQNSQYRIYDIKDINKVLKANRGNYIFETLLRNIFGKKFPVYRAISVKEMIRMNTEGNPINWFSVDFNKNLKDDREATKRMVDLLKVTDDNYRSVFFNQSISCEEAYFYLDLFRGCKFGLSYEQVANNLLEDDIIQVKTFFKNPIYFEKTFLTDEFPVIGQSCVTGFHFIAKIYNGKYKVIRSDNTELTAKFGILRRISNFLPQDKKIVLDFMVQPKEQNSMLELEKRLNGSEPIKKANLVILDLYEKNDKANTIKRLSRIEKLIDKCRAQNMSCVYSVPFKVLNSQDEVNSFVKRMLAKRGSVIIKPNASYKQKVYKAINQFSNETMLLEDYKLKQVESPSRKITLDSVKCKTNLGETIYVKNWSGLIESNIFNLVGSFVSVKWENSKEPYPFIYGINKYKLACNLV